MVYKPEQYALCYECATGKKRTIPKISKSDALKESKASEHNEGKFVNIEFMRGDQDESAFNAYFASMPWVASKRNLVKGKFDP